jgi:hypothetical protein
MSVIHRDSAGYNGLMNSPLARPKYHDKIMVRVEERDFLADITNSEISERIEDCGQIIQILRPPEVAPWRSYNLNQPLVYGQVGVTAFTLAITNAAYQALKFDELTISMACDQWDDFERAFLEENYQKFVAFQRDWVLTRMLASVHPGNIGVAAGKKKNINLGAQGAPRVINSSTITTELSQLKQVLNEHEHWIEGQMWLLVPLDLQAVMINSNFANMAWVGGTTPSSLMVDGSWPYKVVGFDVIETQHLVSTMDGGKLCFWVMAGSKDAFSYAANIIKSEVINTHDYFGVVYRMLAVWGGAAIYPKFMAAAYWTFDPYNI